MVAASAARTPATRFLDPAVLARLGNLELIARSVVSGFISGLHRSPLLGLSVDFAEHRSYMPGDDVRRIDWRLFARSDRLYVKETEADTNANFTLLIDASRSMDYASGSDPAVSKLDYARFAAASLAYLVNRQRDRVGLLSFDAATIDVVPPSAKHYESVLHTLDRLRPGAAGDPAAALRQATPTLALNRRGVLVLLSDLYTDPSELADALGALRSRGNEIIVLHLLDPAELTLELPGEGALSLEDLESGERLAVLPDAFREEYRRRLDAHCDALRDRLAAAGVDYARFDTSRPLDYLLFEYLSSRARRARSR